jgi:nitroreductase
MPTCPDPLSHILERRSIRKYLYQPVEDEHIGKLLQAAMAAPSAVGKDPWRFIVVREQVTRDAIADGLTNGRMLRGAPLGIVVCGDQAAAHGELAGYMLQDCSAAIENMLIAAPMLGLGAVWLGVHPRAEREQHLRQVLAIPERITPIAVVSVGYPDEEKEPRTRYDAAFVHWEKW